MSSPDFPWQPEPSPCRPRSARNSRLYRYRSSVLSLSVDSRYTSPPLPPSPPEGPPRGTYFSLRNAMQPFPPPPALTMILASSTNTGNPSGAQGENTPHALRKTKARNTERRNAKPQNFHVADFACWNDGEIFKNRAAAKSSANRAMPRILSPPPPLPPPATR